jgi:beta-glucanase (GH16 family)
VLAACLLVVIALVVANSGSSNSPALQAASSGEGAPSAPAGFTQVFLDNFAGPKGAPPSAQNWFYDIGTDWGNQQVEQDTNATSNIYLDGQGNLVIQANKANGKWTSGRIESTRGDFIAPPGGKLEMTASLQQPNVASPMGYWPAFWALGSPMRTGGEWPAIGELDMIEDVNGLNEATQTLHYTGGAPHTPLAACPDTGTSCQAGFHTYTVIIDRTHPSAESLQFLIDGKAEATFTEAQAGVGPWRAAIDHGFFMLLDLAMGGSFPDGACNCTTPTASTTSGGLMKVAYVAVYEQGGNSTPTAKATAAGQITGFQGKCLSNMGAVNTTNNPTALESCDHSDGQLWQPYSDSTLRAQGGCLDVVNGHTAPGTAAVWYPCNQAQSQVWQPKSNGELFNAHSGLCLTAADNDTPLDIEPCTDSPQQQWHLPA